MLITIESRFHLSTEPVYNFHTFSTGDRRKPVASPLVVQVPPEVDHQPGGAAGQRGHVGVRVRRVSSSKLRRLLLQHSEPFGRRRIPQSVGAVL